jgi:hypothetical protein
MVNSIQQVNEGIINFAHFCISRRRGLRRTIRKGEKDYGKRKI